MGGKAPGCLHLDALFTAGPPPATYALGLILYYVAPVDPVVPSPVAPVAPVALSPITYVFAVAPVVLSPATPVPPVPAFASVALSYFAYVAPVVPFALVFPVAPFALTEGLALAWLVASGPPLLASGWHIHNRACNGATRGSDNLGVHTGPLKPEPHEGLLMIPGGMGSYLCLFGAHYTTRPGC